MKLKFVIVSLAVHHVNKISMQLIPGGKDTLSCENCKAHQHLIFGLGGLKWALLEQYSQTGEGRRLIGRRFEKKQWHQMAEKIRSRNIANLSITEVNQPIREKEIIREKEVIIKIRCSYCKNTYNEILDKCPHCGARAQKE